MLLCSPDWQGTLWLASNSQRSPASRVLGLKASVKVLGGDYALPASNELYQEESLEGEGRGCSSQSLKQALTLGNQHCPLLLG